MAKRVSRWLRGLGLWAVCFAALLPLHGDEVRFAECPPAVRSTVERNLLGGKVDEIMEIRINDHALYLVELDLKGFRDAKLYVAGDGSLRKIVEEVRLRHLPESVRRAVEQHLGGRAHVDDIEKVTIGENVRYHVEIEEPRQPDRTLVFEEDGAISSSK